MKTSSPPDTAAVELLVIGFLTEDLGWDGDPQTLCGRDCRRLTEALDSQDLLELACFVEDTYDVQIADAEITVDTFGTLSALADFVVAKCVHHSTT